MRKGILSVGVAMLLIGIVVFVIAVVGAARASADFMSCVNGFPSNPTFGFPSACADAMNAFWMYQGFEALGGILGLFGFILFLLGAILQPERPAPAPMPYYPPPVYGSPGGYAPPQGPQAPPPQP